MDYGKLRNGSDIRGVALEGVAGQSVTLDQSAVEHIARGFLRWLRQQQGEGKRLRIAVGRDSRISGPDVARWLDGALALGGADVTDMGLCTTPAMFMTTVTEGYLFDGAVMITASHLPWNRNGLKFFTARGGAESEDIKEILALGEAPLRAVHTGSVVSGDFMDAYAAILREKICAAAGKDRPLEGYKIVVDEATARGASSRTRSSLPWGRTPPAAGIWSRTDASPTTCPIRSCPRPWTASAPRCWRAERISASSSTPTWTGPARCSKAGKSSTATGSSP